MHNSYNSCAFSRFLRSCEAKNFIWQQKLQLCRFILYDNTLRARALCCDIIIFKSYRKTDFMVKSIITFRFFLYQRYTYLSVVRRKERLFRWQFIRTKQTEQARTYINAQCEEARSVVNYPSVIKKKGDIHTDEDRA